MIRCALLLLFGCLLLLSWEAPPRKVFDVHLHGSADPDSQMHALRKHGIYKAAISTSWDLQERYRSITGPRLLYGLMFPCPGGKVPYSGQACFADGARWPDPAWVEAQVRAGRIDYFGELLGQYFGIASSDSALLPYYALAVKYDLPVGVHTGGAGPGHGSPDFKWELGKPSLLEPVLARFPGLRLWVMHGGDQYYQETIALMSAHPGVYTDISVLCNPAIVKPGRFAQVMKAFIDAGLEDRLLFGTDNGDAGAAIAAVEALDFLGDRQRRKLFYRNAERFFAKRR